MFDAITRGDAGVYRVEVVTRQGSGTVPDQDRRVETSFQVDVRGECCSDQVPFCDLGSISHCTLVAFEISFHSIACTLKADLQYCKTNPSCLLICRVYPQLL